MFELDSLCFNHEDKSQIYRFTAHSFVYGMNTVGKTAMTMAIDFVLGSSEGLTYQGLDNIDSIEAHLTNGLTNLWIKRDISGGYYYRRTEKSEYSEVGADIYKNNICLMITPNPNDRYIDVYSKVFDETPTFRSFNFLNYIEEKGLGDLSVVFTKAKELKHQIRIGNIMDFFFNYDNIEQIYEKEVELEKSEAELEELSKYYQEYSQSIFQAKKMFKELQLPYTGDFDKDNRTFLDFKTTYTRKAKSHSKDLVFLSKASFSLAEEIKLYSFMKAQSQNMIDRKERIKRLLAIMNIVVEENPEYADYMNFITNTIEEINSENVILSLPNYQKAINDIENEKRKLDRQIGQLKGQASEITYEEAMKKVGLLEHIFETLRKGIDTSKICELQNEALRLKKEIKNLKSSFNQTKINDFNTKLTDLYLKSNLDIKYLNEDLQDPGFALEFDPFRLCLYAVHEDHQKIIHFMPGSMARQTHLQMLTYINMLDYLQDNFKDFIYLPLLIIDSANQPMGIDSFQKVYPTIVELADKIGVQTIFLSKDHIDGISSGDFIDISNGLNMFHQKSK